MTFRLLQHKRTSSIAAELDRHITGEHIAHVVDSVYASLVRRLSGNILVSTIFVGHRCCRCVGSDVAVNLIAHTQRIDNLLAVLLPVEANKREHAYRLVYLAVALPPTPMVARSVSYTFRIALPNRTLAIGVEDGTDNQTGRFCVGKVCLACHGAFKALTVCATLI